MNCPLGLWTERWNEYALKVEICWQRPYRTQTNGLPMRDLREIVCPLPMQDRISNFIVSVGRRLTCSNNGRSRSALQWDLEFLQIMPPYRALTLSLAQSSGAQILVVNRDLELFLRRKVREKSFLQFPHMEQWSSRHGNVARIFYGRGFEHGVFRSQKVNNWRPVTHQTKEWRFI